MKKYIHCLMAVTVCIASSAQPGNSDSLAKRQQQKMAIMMTRPKVPIKTIGIFLYDGYQTLDAMGPYETLGNLPGVKLIFIAKQKGFVKNQRGMKVKVDTAIAEVKKLDILVIPGGAAETYLMTQDSVVLSWIRTIDKTTTYTTSVCTGAWILGATGLLNGKNATTNWYRAEEMLKKYGATFKDARWVQDGKYWTSAGVTAGIDMSLAIINDLMGEQYTQAAMLNLEYNPGPPITGGSPKNTEPIVTEMMQEMYDIGFQPLFTAEQKKPEKENKPVKTVMPEKKKMVVAKPAIKKEGLLKEDAIDPICRMHVSKGSTITATYKGKQYGFCSEGCKEKFLKTPEKYQ